MYKCSILIFIISIIIFPSFSSAAVINGKVEGHIKDAKTGEALWGANVMLVGTSMGAASNENGNFNIPGVPAGIYKIQVTYVGYKKEVLTATVKEGATLKLNFALEAVGVQGKTVVVTAQASGQNAAINQQLSSIDIKNVVSAARIQELPDANAAESVGRLPGVSLIRSGGEGAQVVIRGLSPQYNMVTIDGVQVPPNLGSSRAVDLSDISSSMLGGIEVIKAITPDMDAAVVGGTVNLDLRKAKDELKAPEFDVQAQGGYNDLQSTFSDYKLVGSGESRFLDQRLGLFAEVNAEQRNLTSNSLGSDILFINTPKSLDQVEPVYSDGLTLADEPSIRNRYGATVVLDYKTSDFKAALMNMVSSSDTKTQVRSESYSVSSNEHSYEITDDRSRLNMITNLLDIEKDFSFMSVDAKLSHSYSENNIPNELSMEFVQNSVDLGGINKLYLNPTTIQSYSKDTLANTYADVAYQSKSLARNRNLTANLDFKSNFSFSKDFTGVLKLGGEYKYTINSYNYDTKSYNFINGASDSINMAIVNAFPWMKNDEPPTASNGSDYYLPMTIFADPKFSYGKFLESPYRMNTPINLGLVHQVIDFLNNHPLLIPKSYDYVYETSQDAELSHINDYSGNEYESAAYIMSTFNLGEFVTFIPGVRYQNLVTSYTATRGTQTTSIYEPFLFGSLDTTIEQQHGYWLPMAHLIIKPLSWMQLHLAYTNTLSYPSYSSIIPRVNVGFSSVIYNNFALKPSRSENYDAIVSVYSNEIGLFTIDGFLKHIKDVIFSTSAYLINPAEYPGLPSRVAGYPLSTYSNDPYTTDLWGIELDWQTHFWYLPGPLSGLVLNINYTHDFSQAKYPRISKGAAYYDPITRKYVQPIDTSYYTDRLIYQPDNVVNLSVGYDLGGFSARVSLLVTSNVFEGDNFWPELRVNTAQYTRWDLSVKQDLPWYGVQAFFDVNNLNSEKDVNINQGSGYPTSESVYGLTADFGFRKTF